MQLSDSKRLRKEKQSFLKETIDRSLEEPFSEYLASKKPNGTDIDEWTLEELKEEVLEFKRQKGISESKKQESPEKELLSQKSIRTSKTNGKMRTSNLLGDDFPEIEEIEKIPNSNSVVESGLFLGDFKENSSKLRANVSILDDKKFIFVIEVFPKMVNIKRKYTDLIWLRSKLQTELPFYYIPPIKSEDFKREFIQNFFNRLLDMKFATSSKTLEIFFDDDKFAGVKAEEIRNVEQLMADGIDTKSAEPKYKDLMAKNEKTYDAYFSQMFPNWKKPGEIDEVVSSLRQIDTFVNTNAKTFSNLKHFSYDLAEHMSKASESLKEIAKTFEDYSKECEKTFTKIGLTSNKHALDVNSKIVSGLRDWSILLNTQKKIVVNYLANFFHFKKHENLSFTPLIKSTFDYHEKAKKKLADLDSLKKKLFDEKKPIKWKIDSKSLGDEDMNEVIRDYSKAKKFMLPGETAPTEAQVEASRFLNKHVLFEYVNFILNEPYYGENNFNEFGEKMVKSMDREELIWNVFSGQGVDVSNIDREGTEVLK